MSENNLPTLPPQVLQTLAVAALSIARSDMDDQRLAQVAVPALQQALVLMAECIPLTHLGDRTLLRHGVHALADGHSVEETVMHVFTLYIYRLREQSSRHPLEQGIIRQKIIGILPIFENAMNQRLIRLEMYDRNADALAHIAENSPEVPDILAALAAEYRRLERA